MNTRSFIKFELFLVTAILSFCSIVYELLLSNTLALITGNYVFWQAMTIGVYIGGLGLGSYFSGQLKNIYKTIINVELGLSFLGAISVIYIYFFHSIYKYADTVFLLTGSYGSDFLRQNVLILKIFFFIVSQALTLMIGILSGFEIPLMIRLAEDKIGNVDKNEYQILGVSYIGTLLGTICFAYFLLPQLDIIKTSVVVALLNLLVCIYCKIKLMNQKYNSYVFYVVLVLGVICLIGFNEKEITQKYLKLFYHTPRIVASNDDIKLSALVKKLNGYGTIERSKSLYQYVDIYSFSHVENNNFVRSTILALDTHFQFNTSTEMYYHEAFAHISILLNKKIPKKILLLGGGDGLLLRELVKYKEVEFIKHIELDQKIIDLAKNRFANLNKNSLTDIRVHSEVNDGFYYIRNTNDKYDAIFIDFPYPYSFDLARLYSIEFYTYIKKALTPEGFVVLDAPFHDQENYLEDKYLGRHVFSRNFEERHQDSNNTLASTLYYAGFKTLFPYILLKESFLFLKVKEGAIDPYFMDHGDFSKFHLSTIEEMKKIKNQNFPYKIDQKYINSIFRPIMTMKTGF